MIKPQRRRFWVDPALQLQMLVLVMALVLGSIFLVAFSVLHGLEEASLESHEIFHSMDWIRATMRGSLLVSACISGLASAVLALIWSHRFVGPLRVLCAAISRLAQGDLSVPVRIRKSDAHQELIHEFAQMQERLHHSLGADLQAVETAARRLQQAASQLPEGHEIRREIDSLLETSRSIASHYKL